MSKTKSPTESTQAIKNFSEADIPQFVQKIFSEFDKDRSSTFTKRQFPIVVQSIIGLVGGETPTEDDVEDLFNLLDINGDEKIDRKEFTSLLTTFFRVLREHHIRVEIGEESDIVL